MSADVELERVVEGLAECLLGQQQHKQRRGHRGEQEGGTSRSMTRDVTSNRCALLSSHCLALAPQHTRLISGNTFQGKLLGSQRTRCIPIHVRNTKKDCGMKGRPCPDVRPPILST